MTATLPPLAPQLSITWPLLPDDYILPDDPVENTDQHLLANALLQALSVLPEKLENALITTDFALCAGINERIICKAPDWMYVQPVEPLAYAARRSYTPHTEGPVPQLVMEFLSATYGEEYSVESQQRIGKWFFYEQVIRVPTYIIFQPETPHLEVYHLESGRYKLQTPDASNRYSIPELGLSLGIWEGYRDTRTGYWLRWWTSEGELLLWPEERLEQERQRVEAEHQRAEAERQRAEAERQRAEAERQRAEAEHQRAEAERQRAERLAERLRQLGINADED